MNAFRPPERHKISYLEDSRRWEHIDRRPDDIVISTPPKSGTTWMQGIVTAVLWPNGDAPDAFSALSPWIDFRLPPIDELIVRVETQDHRRFLKTHLPVDALVFSPRARYIYIGRDGRDVLWSLHNHHTSANALWYEALNDTPGRVGPPIDPPTEDIREYWKTWLEKDGHPFWPFWENIRSWWAIRDLPNVHLVHFADMKRDMTGEMRRMAAFLDISIDESRWDRIVEYCQFDWMKANATKSVPLGGAMWDGGAESFIHKGVNGRWTDTLTAEQSAAYEARAVAELGEDCADWLKGGQPT